MPLLLYHIIDTHTRVAVWKATEAPDYFLEALMLTSSEQAHYDKMKPHRQKEWLSSRYLLHKISGDEQRTTITKTKLGKPERAHCRKYISISHSKDFTAAVISDRKVGIDIQKPEKKIEKIAHKFISKQEALRLEESRLHDYYHIFWGAKEAMYKAYGLKKLEFREHMHLYPFRVSDTDMEIKGWVRKNGTSQDYQLLVKRIEGTYLVVSMLEKEMHV